MTPTELRDFTDRLRGIYRIPITDGLGPAGGEEPENAQEFVRTFDVPPIQRRAADYLDVAMADNARLRTAQVAAEDMATAVLARVSEAATFCDDYRALREALGRVESAVRQHRNGIRDAAALGLDPHTPDAAFVGVVAQIVDEFTAGRPGTREVPHDKH